MKVQFLLKNTGMFERLGINSAHDISELILDEVEEADLYNHKNFLYYY